MAGLADEGQVLRLPCGIEGRAGRGQQFRDGGRISPKLGHHMGDEGCDGQHAGKQREQHPCRAVEGPERGIDADDPLGVQKGGKA